MVHSARKHIRRHRRVDESPLNTDVLNSILLVSLATPIEKYPPVLPW